MKRRVKKPKESTGAARRRAVGDAKRREWAARGPRETTSPTSIAREREARAAVHTHSATQPPSLTCAACRPRTDKATKEGTR